MRSRNIWCLMIKDIYTGVLYLKSVDSKTYLRKVPSLSPETYLHSKKNLVSDFIIFCFRKGER